MDPLPPVFWLLVWRDYTGRHVGDPRPPIHRKRFKPKEAAHRKLDQLGAADGADIRGFISAVPPKPPPAQQTDFGFPPDGKRRLTD